MDHDLWWFCDYGVDGVREGRWGRGSGLGRLPGSKLISKNLQVVVLRLTPHMLLLLLLLANTVQSLLPRAHNNPMR